MQSREKLRKFVRMAAIFQVIARSPWRQQTRQTMFRQTQQLTGKKKISTTQKSLPKSVTQFRWYYGGTSQALIHSCDSTKLLVALRCSRLPLLLSTSKLDQIVSQVNKSRHYYTDKFAQLRQSPKLLPGLWLSRDFIVAERMATLVKYDIVERTNGLSLSASKCKPVAADMTNVSPRQFCRCNSLPKYRYCVS